MQDLQIFLSGRITDLSDSGKGWRDQYLKEIIKRVPNVKSIGTITELVTSESQIEIVRSDIKSIRNADVVIVNGTIPLLVGCPMELVLAKYFKKLVITVLDKNSPYFRDGIINPWLAAFSDYAVFSLSEAIEILKEYEADKDRIEKSITKKDWEDLINGAIENCPVKIQ